jgi:hypothetical protein
MRRQEIRTAEAFDIVEAPSAISATRMLGPTPAVPDMPKAAGALMIAAYGAIIAAFVLTIHGARSEFAIFIATFYVAMFFAVPTVFLRVERNYGRRPDLLEFLDQGVATATGHISGTGALVQMLIVPVLLAFAILAMGITYLIV